MVQSAGCSISFEILGKVGAMSQDSRRRRTAQSNAKDRSHSRDEYGATLVAQLKARSDEKRSTRKTKFTSMGIPPPIYETFQAAAKRQGISMAAILRLSLEGVLSELVKLRLSGTTSGDISASERHAREVASRLAMRKDMVAKGYYFFPVRLSRRTHRMLRRAAVKHDTNMSRIMVAVLESDTPYLMTHSWRQCDSSDKK